MSGPKSFHLPRCVVQHMGRLRQARLTPVGVVLLFLISTLMQGYAPTSSSDFIDAVQTHNAVTLGLAEGVTIGSFPDGASTKIELEIPDGEAIQGLDLEIESARLQSSMANSWTDANDFSTGAVYDGMDVNGTSLSVLPQGWEWDFENANHGWTLGSPAWLWGFDSTIGQAGGTSSGTKALYTYDGNYPNGMGSTIWATSPVMDCSSCSGAWELDFMKRLGIESSTWDHAYVSVKGTNGNWANVYSNSGSVSDSSMVPQTISITNYVASNPNFQVRFGIGTTDTSVQYTGWNIDDVTVLPTNSGISSGEGNWTSPAFGPSQFGQGESKAFGLLHMDATIPTGSLFEWRLLDALTNQPVLGFEHMTDVTVDLGMVDWQAHPLVRIDLHLESGQGGIPTVHGFHFDGSLFDEFNQNPTAYGWQLQGASWANGQVSGTGDATSPTYNVRSGFAGIISNSDLTGSGVLQASTDGGATWVNLLPGAYTWFDAPMFTAKLRIDSTGGTWTMETLDVELIRTSVADGLRFDVGLDGVSDWSMDLPEVGRLGIQDRFINGDFWQSRMATTNAPALFDLALPLAGTESFEFAFASPDAPFVNPTVRLSIAGQDIVTKSLSSVQDLEVVTFTNAELNTLNAALSQATQTHGVLGLPLVAAQLSIGSTTSTSSLVAGGVFAPYDSALEMDFTSSDALLIALNGQLQSATAIGGMKTITMPVRMSSTGALSITINQIDTQTSVEPVSIVVNNVTDTFVPSQDWIDVTSTFDLSALGVTDAASYVKSNGWSVALQLQGAVQQSLTTCPFIALPATGSLGCATQGSPMIWTDNGAEGSKTVLGSGALLQIDHRFKFTEQWDDEASLTLSVNLIAPTGPMLPVSVQFGLGDAQGVENDVELQTWRSVNANGISSELAHPFLHPGEAVTIEAVLAFQGLDDSPSPRSGSVDVCFFVDDVQTQCTAVLMSGVASFPWTVPINQETVELKIELTPLQGQAVSYLVDNVVEFSFDTVAPELLQVSIEEFDHMEAAPLTSVDFIIADSPVLPSHAYVHAWQSWVDDSNMNGFMDAGEVSVYPLHLPTNRNISQGRYVFSFDSSSVESGSMFRGWLDVADAAGNPMLASGSFDAPLFNLQINNDGAPQLGSTPASWNSMGSAWLHPGEMNTISAPVWDMNGISDLATIEINLASNQLAPVNILWNATSGQCTTNEMFLTIDACSLLPIDSASLFPTEGQFVANFSLEWGFDPDVSLVRVPSLLLHDHSGQSTIGTLSDLDWRFSGEMSLPRDGIDYTTNGDTMEGLGTWIQPRTEVGVFGDLVWYRSEKPVMQMIELEFDLGGIEATVESVNGSFNGSVLSPLAPGTYGLSIDLFSPPNGAIDRSEDAAYAYFIVDQDAPSIVGIASPMANQVLEESMWSEIKFAVLIDEEDRLNENDLTLHWAVRQAGVSISTPVVVNGSIELLVVGGKPYGTMVPTEGTLNLDEILTTSMRSQSLELHIYVTGTDIAGQEMSSFLNDLDAPLSVWSLEQRVPEYSFVNPSMKPSKDIAQGDVLKLSVTIENNGLADGMAQMFVERVESNGARTRIDAREIEIPAGGQFDYTKEWMPDRSGTMWIEYHIINDDFSKTNTVFVDEPRTEGFLGSVAAVNPVLLVIIFLLTVSLVAVLMFGLQGSPTNEPNRASPRQVSKSLPTLKQPAAEQPAEGPYGAQQAPTSPGENPYQ